MAGALCPHDGDKAWQVSCSRRTRFGGHSRRAFAARGQRKPVTVAISCPVGGKVRGQHHQAVWGRDVTDGSIGIAGRADRREASDAAAVRQLKSRASVARPIARRTPLSIIAAMVDDVASNRTSQPKSRRVSNTAGRRQYRAGGATPGGVTNPDRRDVEVLAHVPKTGPATVSLKQVMVTALSGVSPTPPYCSGGEERRGSTEGTTWPPRRQWNRRGHGSVTWKQCRAVFCRWALAAS